MPSVNYLQRFAKELYSVLINTDKQTFSMYISQVILNFLSIIQKKNLILADKGMYGKTCKFKVCTSKKLIIGGEFFSGAREIYYRRVYFTVPDFEIHKDDTVVDLGANVGVFTTLAALCGKKVISIEAQSGFIPIIESNLKKNSSLEKVFINLGIVGANSGVFANPIRRTSASHWSEDSPILNFDEIIRQNDLERVDFLKIDIEGSEFDLFTGNTSWLSKVERVAMEVHLDFGEINEIISTIKNADFTFSWLTTIKMLLAH